MTCWNPSPRPGVELAVVAETVNGLHRFVIQSASGGTDVRALFELTGGSLPQQPHLFLPTKATSPIFPALDVVSPLLGARVEILQSRRGGSCTCRW